MAAIENKDVRYEDRVIAAGMATVSNPGYIEKCQAIRKNIDECQAMLMELVGATQTGQERENASPPGRANALSREIDLINGAVIDVMDSIRSLVTRF